MDYLDIESFRSKYSDLTVTAVPNAKQPKELEVDAADANLSTSTATPCVEITRVPLAATPTALQLRSKQKSDTAYASEYKQLIAKLEYTKYMQGQLQLLSLSNGGAAALALDGKIFGWTQPPTAAITLDENANIVDKYQDLLTIIAEMQANLSPCAMGLRAPKERLLRDIAHARVILRECCLLLERDEEQQQPTNPAADE